MATQRVIDRSRLKIDRPPSQAHMRLITGAFTPNGEFFVAASARETLVWSVGNPDPIARVPCGVAGRGLAISSDGTRLATSDSDSGPTIRVWSLPQLSEIQSWQLDSLGSWDLACAVAFTPDGQRIVVAGWDGVLRRLVVSPMTREHGVQHT